MRRIIILLFFVLVVSLVQTSQARKLALLVGVDEYENVSSLECCVNDMKLLKESLLNIGFEENDIQMLITGDKYKFFPKKKRIEERIDEILSQARYSDLVFIAFSGHGAQNGKNVYFCLPDTDMDDLDGTSVSITQVMDDLSKCKAKFKWMVVDACRINMSQGSKGFGSKGLKVVPTPPAGIALLQSCAEGEESWEDRDIGNSFFTKNFVAALSGEADENKDGKLTLMEVCSWTMEHTKEQVKKRLDKDQRPYFSGSFSDFTLTETPHVLDGLKLIEEARKAKADNDYPLALKKYDEALALCPKFENWKREREDAQRIFDLQPKPKSTIVVPDDFPTLSEAYANAKDGEVILIKPGKYELSESMTVDRPVTFQGMGDRAGGVIIDSPSSDAFIVTGGSPSFQNLTVRCSGEKCNSFYIASSSPKLSACVITSSRGTGVYIEGKDANPQLKMCVIKDCGSEGMILAKESQGKFYNCDIYGNAQAGIMVKDWVGYPRPVFYRCKIHDGKDCGVSILENGSGEFRYCDIYGNAKSGIEMSDAISSSFWNCKIHDGKMDGVYVHDKGGGMFCDCDIYGNAQAGIHVETFGDTYVSGCKIHHGKGGGVFVHNNGKGRFIRNVLENNYLHGKLYNWIIASDAGEVKEGDEFSTNPDIESKNSPPIPTERYKMR